MTELAAGRQTDHDDGDDDAEEADGAAENLDNEHFDEQRLVLSVSQGASRPDHTDTQTTAEVTEPGDHPSTEHHESCTHAQSPRNKSAVWLLINKKFELMLTTLAKANSSFCQQIALLYLQLFRRNSLTKCAAQPKIAEKQKNPLF